MSGASSFVVGFPPPPPLLLRYFLVAPNTFAPSGPVTLMAFVRSPSGASTSNSTFSPCILFKKVRSLQASSGLNLKRTSRKLRNPSAFKCDWCTKISSLPSSGTMNPNPLDALNHLTVRVRFWWSEKREREREAFDDDDEFTTKRRPDNRFQKQKKVIKQFEREYKKRSRATFFRTHQRQFFSTSISNRRNLSPGVSFVIVLLSETDGEMCARDVSTNVGYFFYFLVENSSQANQFTPKNFFFSRKVKMARSGSLGSRICPRSRFTFFFFFLCFFFVVLFAFCFFSFNWICFK